MSDAKNCFPPWPDELPNLRTVPFSDLLGVWDRLDNNDKDLNSVRALCEVDRYYLLIKVCNRFDAWHPWIYDRCREVENDPDGYLDLWAREHYKSTIITFGGVLQAILCDPDLTVGIFSHTKPIAKGFLRQIQRELETNERLKILFPDVLWANPEKESPQWALDGGIVNRRSSNPKEATVEAHGLIDGQPTSKHFGLLVYDDVVTLESVTTPEQIKKTTEAWELSDNLGRMGGRKWHVGTRYNFADTYFEIMHRGAARARVYPATSDGTIGGTPVLLTNTEWQRRVRDQGEATVACQMLQNPLAGHQRMFDQADLRTYEVRPETLMVYVLCDPARSIKKDSDNTAFVVIGLDYAGNKYLLDGYNHKMDLQSRWQAMLNLWRKWHNAAGVQGIHVGYERYGAIADLDYFKERQEIDRASFEIVELEWPREGPGSKIDRVQRLGPDLRSHRFYVPYPTDQDRLTREQRKALDSGYGYRVSQRIRRKDHQGNIYDLTEQFKLQVHYFPFGGKKDIVDAASRLYDIEPRPPVIVDQQILEPEFP